MSELSEEDIFSSEEISDVVTDTWRWGSCHRRIFRHEGKTYAVEYRWQPEEGITDWEEPYEVKEVEETMVVVKWVAV